MQTVPGQPAPRRNYLTIAQLIVSGLGLVFSLVAAAVLALLGLTGLAGATSGLSGITVTFSVAWIGLLVGILAIPSIVYSIQRLGGHAPALPRVNGFRLASTLVLLWPLALFLGSIVSRQPGIAWLFLPPLQLLAVGLPVWWLFELLRRRLPAGSRQRGWGINNFSIFITTPLLMIIEILFIVALVILFAIWASTQPQLANALQGLAERLSSGQITPEQLTQILSPYLQNPLVITGGLAIVGGLIPLIEEMFKPLAMWALAGRRLTPAEGFVAGGLCGASFALVESLFYLSNPVAGGWAFLAIGRAGTELLHITGTALVGWGLASAWHHGAFGKLAGTYLLAVFLHGTWNTFSILTGLAGSINNPPASLQPFINLARIAPVVLILLAILLFGLVLGVNQHLQRQSSSQAAASLAGRPPGDDTGPGAGPSSSSS